MRFDATVYTGEYPFRGLPPMRGDGLLEWLDRLEVERAIATAFPSIFYWDSLDGLRQTIADTNGCGDRILHFAVVNPNCPGWRDDIDRAFDLPGVIGLRLYPRYHGYRLDGAAVNDLMTEAGARGLIVSLAARLMDDRLHPRFLESAPLETGAVAKFVAAFPGATVLLSQFMPAEWTGFAAAVRGHPSAFIEVSGLGLTMTTLDNLESIAPVDRWVFGTGAPLMAGTGCWMALDHSNLPVAHRDLIAGGNLAALVARGGVSS